jgi:parallel beta-helix repeat protein
MSQMKLVSILSVALLFTGCDSVNNSYNKTISNFSTNAQSIGTSPSSIPTSTPTTQPSTAPTSTPTSTPTTMPSSIPTATPTPVPTTSSAPISGGKTYYVSPSGQNANNGASSGSSFATITYAASIARAGDVINVLPGTYLGEEIIFNNDGTAAQPIVLQGTAAGVVISGTEPETGFASVGNGIFCQPGWTHFFGSFSAAIIANPSLIYSQPVTYDAQQKPQNQLYLDGVPIAQAVGPGDVLPNTFYTDQPNQKICVKPADGEISGHKIEATESHEALLNTNGHSYITIQNLSFERGATAWAGNALVRITGGSGVQVNGISVSYAAGTGFYATGSNHTVKNSVFNHNGQEGINASTISNSTFSGNETSYNNELVGKTFDSGWEAGGNKFARSNNLIVDHHLSHNNNGPGIWFDVANQNATIRNSVSYENNSAGIMYEISWTGSIYNNLSYDNRGSFGIGIYISSSAGCNVFNNTIWGNDAAGISLNGTVRGDGTTFTSGNTTVNRTVSAVSNVIKNNIIAENQQGLKYGPSMGYTYLSTLPTLAGSLLSTLAYNVSDYNAFYLGTQHGTFFEDGEAGVSSPPKATDLASWQTASGQEAHSTWGDPNFIAGDPSPLVFDPAPAAFAISSANTLAHKGASLSLITIDFSGATRANPPSIGAYEGAGSQLSSNNPVLLNFDAASATGTPASSYSGCSSSTTKWSNVISPATATEYIGALSSGFASCNASLGWLTGPPALAFESSADSYVVVSNDTSSLFNFSDMSFTVSAWFKIPSSSVSGVVVAKGGENGGWAMGVENGAVHFYLKDTANGQALDVLGSQSRAGNWVYLVAVVNTSTTSSAGNTVSLYVNGLPEAATLTRSGLPYLVPQTTGAEALPLILGTAGSTSSHLATLNGSISDVVIFSRALGASEIQNNCLTTEYRFSAYPGLICSTAGE